MSLETEIKDLLAALRSSINDVNLKVDGSEERTSKLAGLIEDLQKQQAEKNSPTISLPGVELEKKKFSFAKAIKCSLSGDWSGAGHEKEVIEQSAKISSQYAMSVGDDSKGGFFVPEQVANEILELAMPQVVSERLGVQFIRDAKGSPLVFKRVESRPTAGWVNENGTTAASDPGFGQLSLRPRSLRALTDVSNWLVRMPSVGSERMVRKLIAQAHTLAWDLAVLRGKGNENEPQGITNTPNINTLDLGTNGATPTLDNLFDAMLLAENNDYENTGWAFHPRTWNTLRKIVDGESNYILDNNSKLLNGIPFAKTTQIPITLVKGTSSDTSSIYTGDFSQVVVAMWGGLFILASNVSDQALVNDQTRIASTQMMDIGVKQPTALTEIIGVRP